MPRISVAPKQGRSLNGPPPLQRPFSCTLRFAWRPTNGSDVLKPAPLECRTAHTSVPFLHRRNRTTVCTLALKRGNERRALKSVNHLRWEEAPMPRIHPGCDRHPNLQMVPCGLKRTNGQSLGYVCPVPSCGRHRDHEGYFDVVGTRRSLDDSAQRNQREVAIMKASGVTSKPANGGHFKTGQRKVAWD